MLNKSINTPENLKKGLRKGLFCKKVAASKKLFFHFNIIDAALEMQPICFTVTYVLKYAERKCDGKNLWLQIKCQKKHTVPLKEWMVAILLKK